MYTKRTSSSDMTNKDEGVSEDPGRERRGLHCDLIENTGRSLLC